MPYHGPDSARIMRQQTALMAYAGETGIWRQYASASTASGTGVWAGVGTTLYYRQQVITGLWALAPMGNFQERQLPGGQVMAGDVMLSTQDVLGKQDEVQWRGVTYRIEGDSMPVHLGGRVWYRTMLRRGDVTG